MELCRITIDIPSPGGCPIPPGRSFYVSGRVETDEPLPEDTVLEVCLADDAGRVIRRVSRRRGDKVRYAVPSRLTDFFCSDTEALQKTAQRDGMVEFLTAEGDDTESGFSRAGMKCVLSDCGYKALIVSAGDEAHGAPADDGFGFLSPDGTAFSAFPCGQYRLCAALTLGGVTLAAAEKPIAVGQSSDCLLARFYPESHYNNMKRWSEERGFAMNADPLPGFFYGINGKAGGKTMLYCSADLALYRNAHTHMFVYMTDPTSSSWSVELPFMARMGYLGDAERFTAYHYDIGEPEIVLGDRTIYGHITAFRPGRYHELCRVDTVRVGGEENVFSLRHPPLTATETDFSRPIRVEASSPFAVMGVLAPAPLEDAFVFDARNRDIRLTNRVETLCYTFSDGVHQVVFEKPVYLRRTEVEDEPGNYDSMLEYYHIFDPAVLPGGMLRVSVIGRDKNGTEVKGTECAFSVNIT